MSAVVIARIECRLCGDEPAEFHQYGPVPFPCSLFDALQIEADPWPEDRCERCGGTFKVFYAEKAVLP